MTEPRTAASKGGSSSSGASKGASPVVVDMGRYSKKRISSLRKGEGPVLDDVQEAIAQLKDDGKITAQAQPVVVIVREKRTRRQKNLKKLLPPFLKI